MRKIANLFALLLLFVFGAVTASATSFAPQEGAKYVLKHVNSGLFLGFQTEYTETNAVNSTFLATEGSQFTIAAVDGGFTLYCDAASEYLTTAGGFDVPKSAGWNPGHSTEPGTPWKILESDTEGQYYLSKDGNNVCSTDGMSVGDYIYTDKGKSVKGLFEIINVDDLNKTQTYSVIINGVESGSVTIADKTYQNGDSFDATNVLRSDIVPAEVAEYDYDISIEGTTITITYNQWPLWTVSVTGLPSDESSTDYLMAGFMYGGQLRMNGSTFRAKSVALTDLTDIPSFDDYSSKITIDNENHTITLAYTLKRNIDTTKAYYLKNVDSQMFVVIPASGNAFISSNEKSKVTFEKNEEGAFAIKGKNGYLGANGWNAKTQAEAFYWTVAESGDDAWTFYQTQALPGFLGLDNTTSGSLFYCNKGAGNHPEFVLVEALPESYSVNIEGTTEDVKVVYKEVEYANGASITSDEIDFADITVPGYKFTASVDDHTITVNILAKKVMNLDEISDNKAYYLICGRGQLTTIPNEYEKEEGVFENHVDNGSKYVFWQTNQISYENQYSQFAIIKKEGKVYLWSVGVPGFVFNDKAIKCEKGAWAAELTPQANGTFMFKVGGKVLNMQNNASGLIIDNYTTPDPGNMFEICEAGNFDPSAALALINALGDIDDDDDLDLDDLEVLVELVKAGQLKPAADLDGDFKVTIGDIVKLIEKLHAAQTK